VDFLAELLDIAVEDVAQATFDNACRFFKLA
ncbi:MAG: hydrolase TatD, partial [Treponema sp.]|nr:hydrolase TatD [Treponema sp.]